MSDAWSFFDFAALTVSSRLSIAALVVSKERSNIMKRYFTRNIETKGRIVRGLVAVVLLSTAIVSFQFSVFLGLVLLVSGSFILFEALRAWCALRACGIKTKI